MTAWDRLRDVLRTDPRDVGCGHTRELLHVYAQILADGGDPETELPGITVHLAVCLPCREDLVGVMAAIGHDDGAGDVNR